MRTIKAFLGNESGATAIEYALIAVLISISFIAAAKTVGLSVSNKFTLLARNLS